LLLVAVIGWWWLLGHLGAAGYQCLFSQSARIGVPTMSKSIT